MGKSEYTSECKHIKGRKNKMKIGIVGLPNVGKSTLFNSITNAGAECANYPFCTIEPNVGARKNNTCYYRICRYSRFSKRG